MYIAINLLQDTKGSSLWDRYINNSISWTRSRVKLGPRSKYRPWSISKSNNWARAWSSGSYWSSSCSWSRANCKNKIYKYSNQWTRKKLLHRIKKTLM